MSAFYFDSRNPDCKTPFGAVKTGETVVFSLHVPKDMAVAECSLALLAAGETPAVSPCALPMSFAGGTYRSNVYQCAYACDEPLVWFYHFEVAAGGVRYTVTRGENGAASTAGGDSWQLTVYDAAMKLPAVLREGVMYQIFPDRFYASGKAKNDIPADRRLRADWGGQPEWRPNELGKVLNNDYFGGDLAGIEQKLDYLASLGVTCLYLNPIFEAHSNHRYDTADYTKIDPLLGDEDDFRSLCKAAKKRGIAVILDGVFSHTGADSVYFNRQRRYGDGGACHDSGSPYRRWYRFGSQHPEGYECWWGFPTLPNVEETDPSYLEFIAGKKGVARKWLGLGASGFRLDVADELPDLFLDTFYRAVKAHSRDCAVIGEVWEDASSKVSYGQSRRYLLGGQMDSVMNYPFKDALLHYMRYGGGQAFMDTVMSILENYPPPVISVLMNSLSTHDTMRAVTALGGDVLGEHDRRWQSERQRLPEHQYWRGRHLFALASMLQYGLPGIPCLYYGDEAGMCGYKDPFNRLCYPWGGEDTGLIDYLRTLGAVRTVYPIFAEADFQPLCFSDELCVFTRQKGEITILFAVNRSHGPQLLPLPPGFAQAKQLAVYGGYDGRLLAELSGVVLAGERK